MRKKDLNNFQKSVERSLSRSQSKEQTLTDHLFRGKGDGRRQDRIAEVSDEEGSHKKLAYNFSFKKLEDAA